MKHPQEERTVVLVKPDGITRGLVGEIIHRIEARGLKIVALQMVWPARKQIDDHYPKDQEYIVGLGRNTLRSYEEFKITTTPKEDYGTDDPHEIGEAVRGWLIEYMASGPVIKIVVEGLHAIRMVRKLIGHTIPAFAEMGTIRGDFSVDSPILANAERRAIFNLIHGSGNPEEAEHEIKHWFKDEEIHSYKRTS